jgi:hypothetical protein
MILVILVVGKRSRVRFVASCEACMDPTSSDRKSTGPSGQRQERVVRPVFSIVGRAGRGCTVVTSVDVRWPERILGMISAPATMIERLMG